MSAEFSTPLTRRTLLHGGVGALAASAAGGVRAAEAVRVRIAYVPVAGASALFVLDGAGWAKQQGIDISLAKFESGPPAIGALASGTIDALAIGIAPVAVARAKGLDVRVVAAMATGGSGFIAGPKLAADFAVAKGDPAAALAAFRKTNGRPAKLATLPPGGVPTVTLNHWLFKLNKTDRADVTIVTMGIEAIQQAVLTGAVDGATVLEPALTLVVERDPRLKVIVNADDMLQGIPGVVLAVSGAFEAAHGAAIDTLVGLVIRATDLIGRDPQEAAKYIQPVIGGGLVDVATIARSLKSPAVRFTVDPRAIDEPTTRMLAYQVELGDFATSPPTSGLFDPSHYLRVTAK